MDILLYLLLRIYWVLEFDNWHLSSVLEKSQLLFLQTLNSLHSLFFIWELLIKCLLDTFTLASVTLNLSFIFSICLSLCAIFQVIISQFPNSFWIYVLSVIYSCIKFFLYYHVSVLEILLGSFLIISESLLFLIHTFK